MGDQRADGPLGAEHDADLERELSELCARKDVSKDEATSSFQKHKGYPPNTAELLQWTYWFGTTLADRERFLFDTELQNIEHLGVTEEGVIDRSRRCQCLGREPTTHELLEQLRLDHMTSDERQESRKSLDAWNDSLWSVTADRAVAPLPDDAVLDGYLDTLVSQVVAEKIQSDEAVQAAARNATEARSAAGLAMARVAASAHAGVLVTQAAGGAGGGAPPAGSAPARRTADPLRLLAFRAVCAAGLTQDYSAELDKQRCAALSPYGESSSSLPKSENTLLSWPFDCSYASDKEQAVLKKWGESLQRLKAHGDVTLADVRMLYVRMLLPSATKAAAAKQYVRAADEKVATLRKQHAQALSRDRRAFLEAEVADAEQGAKAAFAHAFPAQFPTDNPVWSVALGGPLAALLSGGGAHAREALAILLQITRRATAGLEIEPVGCGTLGSAQKIFNHDPLGGTPMYNLHERTAQEGSAGASARLDTLRCRPGKDLDVYVADMLAVMHMRPSVDPSPGQPKGFLDVWRALGHRWYTVRAAAAEVLLRARALLGARDWDEALADCNAEVLLRCRAGDWGRQLSQLYFCKTLKDDAERKARAFARLALELQSQYPPGDDGYYGCYAAYRSLVPGRLLHQAFQQCPTRAAPNARALFAAAQLCGHVARGPELAIDVLAALALRLEKHRKWRRWPDNPSKQEDRDFRRMSDKLDKSINWLRAAGPSKTTVKELQRLLDAAVPGAAPAAAAGPSSAAGAAAPSSAAPAAGAPAASGLSSVAPAAGAAAAGPSNAAPAALAPAPAEPSLDDYLTARVRPLDNGCQRCVVARDAGPEGVAARAAYGTQAECGGPRVATQVRFGKMRACPLAAHSTSAAAIEELIKQHPGEGAQLKPAERKRKVADFMATRFGVQPLGPDTHVVTLYAQDDAGAVTVAEGTGSGKRHKGVYMGFA